MELDIRDIYLLKRRKLGITLDELAIALGCNKSSISRYETRKMNFSLEKQYQQYIDSKQG